MSGIRSAFPNSKTRWFAHLVAALTVIGVLAQPGIAEAGPAHKRLAVLELRGTKIEADILDAFADSVRGGAVSGLAGSDVQVMTRENMVVLLREMGKNECGEGECEVETARNIGADYVISGAVVRMEAVFVVTLKLHETKNGTLLATDSVDAPTQIALLRQLQACAGRLVERIKPQVPAAPPVFPPPTPASPPPTPVWHQPEPAAEDRIMDPTLATIRNHDGFYLRFGFGVGYAYDSIGAELDGMTASTSVTGVGVVPDLAMGTTFGRFVVGGMITNTRVASPTNSDGETTMEVNYQFYAPFLTYYPDTHEGTNYGAAIGLAMPQGSASSSGDSSAMGIGIMGTAGREFWVSDQWSIGGMARLLFMHGSDAYSYTHSALVASLVLTAVYH